MKPIRSLLTQSSKAARYRAISHTVSWVAPPSISKVSRMSWAFSRIRAWSVTSSAMAQSFSQSNCFVYSHIRWYRLVSSMYRSIIPG